MVTVSVWTGTDVSERGPIAGVCAQFVVLGVLAAGVGLGTAGWLTGTAFALVTWATLGHAMRRSGMRSLGPANTVTLARATLVGGVAALVADSLGRPAPVPALVTLATVALLLDAVDGQVARRTGTTSPLGARFDMEIDAFLILVLSVFVAQSLGGWVLAIGAIRYVFVVAAYGLPWLRTALPPRLSRKVVAALQGIILVVAGAGVLPAPLAIAAVGLALTLLCWSFGSDIGWLWRARAIAPTRLPAGAGPPAQPRAPGQHDGAGARAVAVAGRSGRILDRPAVTGVGAQVLVRRRAARPARHARAARHAYPVSCPGAGGS